MFVCLSFSVPSTLVILGKMQITRRRMKNGLETLQSSIHITLFLRQHETDPLYASVISGRTEEQTACTVHSKKLMSTSKYVKIEYGSLRSFSIILIISPIRFSSEYWTNSMPGTWACPALSEYIPLTLQLNDEESSMRNTFSSLLQRVVLDSEFTSVSGHAGTWGGGATGGAPHDLSGT